MVSAPTPFRRRQADHGTLILAIFASVVVTITAALALVAARGWSGNSSSAGVSGSGVAAVVTRTVSPFVAVDLAGTNRVVVHVGGRRTVAVRGDDNLLDHVTTVVRNGTLVIGNVGSFTTKAPMSVAVTVPSLVAATLSGSGVVTVDGARAIAFSSRLQGSGIVRVSGTAERLNGRLDGSGDLQLEHLIARDVTAVLAGSGRVQVHAARTLDATLGGSGTIFYDGDPPSVTKTITGVGTITAQ